MERHQIIEAMTSLKLYGMRASFDEVAGKGLNRRDELYPLLASLIHAEITHRQSRSINYRLSGAKFPVLKDLGGFIFNDTMIDEGHIRELATGAFTEAKRNLILIGGTGTGKTLATGFGLGYTIFSEWLNIVVRKSWAYSDLMPVIPVIDAGLSPVAQWIVLPLAGFWWARRPLRSRSNPPQHFPLWSQPHD
jgi:hypothetical protein